MWISVTWNLSRLSDLDADNTEDWVEEVSGLLNEIGWGWSNELGELVELLHDLTLLFGDGISELSTEVEG